ncbi:MAG: DNA alkylation repair protein [Myxococcota bacterium]
MAALSKDNPFRDVYNPTVIVALGHAIASVWPAFDAESFAADASRSLEQLGMNERADQITDALEVYLPDEYPTAVEVLLGALGDELPEPGKTHWEAFIVLPQCAFVARNGATPEHFETSMRALHEMTRRMSAEMHLRFLIEVDPERALQLLAEWTQDDSPHVRRLVSEGTRTRLPMAGRIRRFIEDPTPVLALLELLKDDPSEYVRRSVANNLNDLAKDNPEDVLDVLERWDEGASEERRWVIRHALRTLVKQGNPRALALLGYTRDPELEVELSVLEDTVALGGEVRFEVTVTSTAKGTQTLLWDYVVEYVKANGARKAKVFKWTSKTLAPGASLTMQRTQHMRPTSGRALYPGEHIVAMQINGVRWGSAPFELVA